MTDEERRMQWLKGATERVAAWPQWKREAMSFRPQGKDAARRIERGDEKK